jgi:PAS domain S-box-containing protein
MDLRPDAEQRPNPQSRQSESDPIRRALQENEDWYRGLVEHSHDLLCIHDLQGRLLSVNPDPAHVLGYSVDEILQIPMRDMVAPEFQPEFDRYLSQIGLTGEAHGLLSVMTRSGDRRIWKYHNTLLAAREAPPLVFGIARDITDEKETARPLREIEERLRGSQDPYRTVHDRSPVGICWAETRTGQLLSVNPKYCEILGRSEEELLGRTFQSLTHPDDLPKNLALLQDLREGKIRHFKLEKRYLRPDGSVRWAEVAVAPMWREGDEPVWHMAIVQDITERKHTEERLREYERTVQGLEEMIVVIDRDYKYTIANRAFLNYLRIKKEEVIGRRVSEVLDPQVFETIVKPQMEACFRGQVVEYEMTYSYPKIGERDLLIKYFPIEGAEGVDRMVGILQDITESKRAMGSLRQSEEKYHLFISQSSEGIFREEMDAPVPVDLSEDELIWHILHDSFVAECNDALARMYGLRSSKELVGKRFADMVPPEDPHNIELTRHFLRSGFRVFEMESHELDVHGDPKVFLNSMIGTIENGMLVGTWGIQRDVTEKVKLEKARQQAEDTLRQKVEELQKVTEELQQAKDKLKEEKLYLEQAIDTELGFGEIVGRSPELVEVMQKVAKVAPSDATVLLLGETGTGKELVARALHQRSNRKQASFIKLNCAAIPSGLLESELFGHEKGAFTGAVARKIGRIELADHGTLFLDEIGEIPLNLQPKLLRVLQDHEFERLGGTQTLKVDFRLLAATNRDLLDSVVHKEFRSDLYYRLNVFPIRNPPLRDRRQDIQLLVEHFVRKYATRMGKSITSIPSKTMEALMQWSWPGNIRELENFVERSVILTPGSTLQAPLGELHADHTDERHKTLREKERERIIQVLRDCKGQLGGPNGAAARLGLKRTTLQSKLGQLGINPSHFRS